MIDLHDKTEQKRLSALRSYCILDTPREVAYDRLTQLAATIFNVPVAFISFTGEDGEWFKSSIGLAVEAVPRSAAFWCHATGDEVLVVPDTDKLRADRPATIGTTHVRFFAAAPLTTAEGYRLGTICVLDPKPRKRTQASKREALHHLSRIVMDELEYRRVSTFRAEAEHDRNIASARLRDFAEVASDWFWETDAKHKIVFVADRTGSKHPVLDASRLLGKTLVELDSSDPCRPARKRHVTQVGRRLPFRDFEFEYKAGTSEEVYIRASGIPIESEAGEFLGYRGVATDISAGRELERARDQAAAEARRAWQLLSDAIEGLSKGFILLDEERRVVLCNQKFREFYPELSASLAPGVYYDEVLACCGQRNGRVLSAQVGGARSVDRRELEEKLPCGRWVKASDFRTKEGGYVGTRMDITTFKANLEALNERTSQLAQAQALARIADWRWVIGSDRFSMSRSISEMLGASEGTFSSLLAEFVGRVHEDDRQLVRESLANLAEGGEEIAIVFRMNGFDGNERVFWADGRREIGPDGQVIATRGVVQDITEQTRKEEELRAAKLAAEQASAAKSEFLANMSHELRTPLNAVIGFSDLIQREAFGPVGHPKYKEYARDINGSGAHLLALISSILDIAKIEAGKTDLRPKLLEMTEVADQALKVTRAAAPRAERRFEVIKHKEKQSVFADEHALRQIIVNLASNAIKYTEQGGSIRISIGGDEEQARLVVEDNGIGIPAEWLDRIGQPFVRSSDGATRKRQGTGVGLYITRTLVHRHGGHFDVESKQGQGTKVTVRLPARNPAAEAVESC